jgi:hypothetical protein
VLWTGIVFGLLYPMENGIHCVSDRPVAIKEILGWQPFPKHALFFLPVV